MQGGVRINIYSHEKGIAHLSADEISKIKEMAEEYLEPTSTFTTLKHKYGVEPIVTRKLFYRYLPLLFPKIFEDVDQKIKTQLRPEGNYGLSILAGDLYLAGKTYREIAGILTTPEKKIIPENIKKLLRGTLAKVDRNLAWLVYEEKNRRILESGGEPIDLQKLIEVGKDYMEASATTYSLSPKYGVTSRTIREWLNYELQLADEKLFELVDEKLNRRVMPTKEEQVEIEQLAEEFLLASEPNVFQFAKSRGLNEIETYKKIYKLAKFNIGLLEKVQAKISLAKNYITIEGQKFAVDLGKEYTKQSISHDTLGAKNGVQSALVRRLLSELSAFDKDLSAKVLERTVEKRTIRLPKKLNSDDEIRTVARFYLQEGENQDSTARKFRISKCLLKPKSRFRKRLKEIEPELSVAFERKATKKRGITGKGL